MELTLIILGFLFMGALILKEEIKERRERKRQDKLNKIDLTRYNK